MTSERFTFSAEGHTLTLEEEDFNRYGAKIREILGDKIQYDRGEETYRYILYLCCLCKVEEEMESILGIRIQDLEGLDDGKPVSSSRAIIENKKVRMASFFKPLVSQLFLDYFLPSFKSNAEREILLKCADTLLSEDEAYFNALLNQQHDREAVFNVHSIVNKSDFCAGHHLLILFGHDIYTNTVATFAGIVKFINSPPPRIRGWSAKDET